MLEGEGVGVGVDNRRKVQLARSIRNRSGKEMPTASSRMISAPTPLFPLSPISHSM